MRAGSALRSPTFGGEGTFGEMDDMRASGCDVRIGVEQLFERLAFHCRLTGTPASR